MFGNIILPLLVFLPMAGAFISYLTGRVSKPARDAVVSLIVLIEAVLAIVGLSLAFKGVRMDFVLPDFYGFGLHLRLDGFRALYACVAAIMWLMTSLFSREYFAHHYRNRNRYYLFVLITLGATVGVMLSASFYTTFIFFEIMSLYSYPWVAHDEKPGAMRAAETYLGVAVASGMVTLMGMFLVYQQLGTLEMDELAALCAHMEDRSALYLPGALVAVGFMAKAGMFPFHIWLPKAHPVAPAPASALLSGVLTKTGVFGVIALTANVFLHDKAWGNVFLAIGTVTMFVGALLAVFSVDLKRTLACSSMSQIGFITVGIGMSALLGHADGLAAHGTVLHMVNHSLFKLVLFMSAGTVYMRLHQLNLNDIRGFGRRKPLLHIAFLLGVLGITGVPMFSGYASKTLLHESILEYVMELQAEGHASGIYQFVETVFVVSGGMTAAYMTKLYIAIFWEKHPTRQAEFDEKKDLRGLSALAVCLPALLIPALGSFPNQLMDPIGRLTQDFLKSEGPHHAVHYFSSVNLIGGGKSLLVGAVLYLGVIRPFLMKKDETGCRVYVNRWPQKLDLEDGFYRPLMNLLVAVGGLFGRIADQLMDVAVPALIQIGTFFARCADGLIDGTVMLLNGSIFHKSSKHLIVTVGTRFTYFLGRLFDMGAALLNKTFRRRNPITTDFVYVFAAAYDEIRDSAHRLVRSVSFGLLLMCIGLFLAFMYLLMHH
ncbi:MAG: NADH dehydrogenase [Clostridia bacterium]|nr:NADH dehydrogenase [Clostridia bacterium]